jgi:hypothetical protein
MRSKKQAIAIVFALNALFWILLAAFFWINAVPFKDRQPYFEEITPTFKFGDWAVPAELETDSLPFTILLSAYRPSFGVAASVTNWIQSESNRTWDDRVGPLSVGALVLISTMLLSFLQWYVIMLLIFRVGAAFKSFVSQRNSNRL